MLSLFSQEDPNRFPDLWNNSSAQGAVSQGPININT
mgnify:CR=1 FL=1